MSAIVTEPGVRWDMPEDNYHADPVAKGSLSHSMAKLIAQPGGPAKLRWQLDHPKPYRKVFDFGHAAHALVLGTGPELWPIPEDHLASNGATSTTKAKDFIAQARSAGAVPLKPAEYQQVKDMALALARDDDAVEVVAATDARHEVSAFTVDPITGLFLRCRFDTIAPHSMGDYKTAVDANPDHFDRVALRHGYHQQAAWYSDTATDLGLTDPDAPFRFVAQEKEPPYLVGVVTLDADFIQIGRDANRAAIDLYAHCLATNTWPGYQPKTISAPPWAYPAQTRLDPAIEAELIALMTGDAA